MKTYDIVLLGNSASVLSFINTFRKFDKEKSILLIDREELPAYSRVLTPYYISGKYSRDDMFIVDFNYYKEKNVDLMLGETVSYVDFNKRTVFTESGKEIGYTYLFIGLGAEARKSGFESDRVLTLRHLSDADRIKKYFSNVKSVVGYGAGLVTLPLLSHLKDDVEKHLLVSSNRIFSRVLDEESSFVLEEKIKRKGVKIHKKVDVKNVETNDRVVISFGNPEKLSTDLIIVGKGVVPNTHLFKDKDIEIGWGVKIDRFAKTNIENVYAGGDIAQDFDFITRDDVTQGNWITAVEHGEIAAKNIAGICEEYEGSLKNNTTEIFGVEVAVVGYTGDDVKSIKYENRLADIYRKVFVDDEDRVIGAVLINETNDAGVYYGLVKRRVKLNDFVTLNKSWNFAKIEYENLRR